MTFLTIEILDTTGGFRLDGALVPAEIIDAASGELVTEVSLGVGEVNRVNVPAAGDYSVRARFPGGRLIQAGASQAGDVRIPAPPSIHEWLSWETAAGEAPAREHYGRLVGRPASETPWVQLWGAEPTSWPAAYSESDLITWKITLRDPLPPGMHYLVLGSGTADARVVVLPAESPAAVTLRPVAPDGSRDRGMAVAVSIASDLASHHHRQVDSVLRYLTRGEIETGQLVAAERLLFEKLFDPTGAAIGGYYLLKTGEYERLHDWPGNFEAWKDYLPDAAIIRGLQLLWDPENRDLEAAAESLTRAASLGPPLLSVGLQMLRQGLHFLGRRTRDEEIESARRTVMSYAEAVDWTSPFTTYWASTPVEPDPGSTAGVPSDGNHVEWLRRRSGMYDFPDAESTTVTVEPRPEGGWAVRRREGRVETSSTFRTKRQAVAFARAELTPSPSARLVVFRADHSIHYVRA